jgi:hypothetical protein
MLHAANWPIKTTLRRALSTCFMFLLAGQMWLQGQESLLHLSPEMDVPKSEDIIKLTVVEDTIPALITQFGEALIMRTFQATPQEFPLFIRTDADKNLERFSVDGDRIYILERSPSTEDNELTLQAFQLTATKAEKFFEHRFMLNRLQNGGAHAKVDLVTSPNRSFGLVCEQERFTKQSKAQFNLLLTDFKTSQVYRIPTPYDGDDIELFGTAVDDQGVIYLGAIAGVKLNSPFRRRYMVFSFHPADSTLTEFDLSSHDLFIHDLTVTCNASGLHIAGLYHSDPLEEKASIGYLYVHLSRDGKSIERRVVSTFPTGLIQDHEGPDSRPEDGIKDLFLLRTLTAGPTPLLHLEKRFKDQICTADPRTGMLNCTDQYHFDGVSLVDVLRQRPVVTIEKRQLDYDVVSNYSGHTSIATSDGSSLLLYNDHFKNEQLKAEKIMNNPNRSVLRCVRIDPNGRISSTVLSDERQSEFVFTPRFGSATSGMTLFVLMQHNRNFRVGHVSLEKL